MGIVPNRLNRNLLQYNEPDKTEPFAFYDLDNLPDKLISHIFEVLKAYQEKCNYFIYRCR